MLAEEQLQAAAQAMLDAERNRTAVTQLTTTYPSMTVADAYAIQAKVVAAKVAAGAKIRGHKIGLTSRAMQTSVGIDEPDYGVLFDDKFFDDGDTIAVDQFIFPRIEVELAFVLGAPLRGPGVTLFDVLDATRYVVPALEIIDGRSKYPRKIGDNIADNAAYAGIILGGRPVKPGDVDLRWVGALLLKNGVVEETGVSAAVLGHPARGIVWLANKLAEHGVGMEAGHVVLAGSFTRAIPCVKGDTFHVDYGPLGSISVHFD